MAKEAFVIELNEKTEFQRLLPGQPQTHGMKSGRVYLEPGAECGLHSTEAREELLVFLSGAGTAAIGHDKILEVAQGKVAYIPPQTEHNIKNIGPQPLIYIYCVAPVND
ncbi:cupin domain-containing protein [Planctomycetota bacterium]